MRLLALLITGLIGYLSTPCDADAATRGETVAGVKTSAIASAPLR